MTANRRHCHKRACTLLICLIALGLLTSIAMSCSPPVAPVVTAQPTTAPHTPTSQPPTETADLATATPVPTAQEPVWPQARIFPGLFYDANSERVLLVGGINRPPRSFNVYASDMWAFNTLSETWAPLGGEARVRYMSGAQAYDAQSDRIVVMDGFGRTMAVLDGDLEQWDVLGGYSPNLEDSGVMVYHAQADRMILFGGRIANEETCSDETWTYDLDTDTWTQMAPVVVPPARRGHVMVYDEESNRVYMWGGWSFRGVMVSWEELEPSSFDRRMWAYDLDDDAWTALGDKGAPPVSLLDAAAAHHPGTGRMILYGGQFGDPDGLSDVTWSYSYADNTWQEIVTDDSPGPRCFHEMVYDAAADKMVLFGGETEGHGWTMHKVGHDFSDETWLFDPVTDQWSQVKPEE